MDQAAHALVGRDRGEEFAPARPREHVGDAHARERARLLLDQHVDRALDLAAVLRRDETHLAELAEPLELGAVAPAGRGRPLGLVVFGPGPEQVGDVGVARIQIRPRAQGTGWPAPADPLRHLGQLDEIVTRVRVGLQQAADLLPQLAEALGRERATRKSLASSGPL